MLEILNFVFSSFWIWAGSFLMLCVLTAGVAESLNYIFGSRWKFQRTEQPVKET